MEITAPQGGVLLHHGAPPGAVINVGAVLAVIGGEGETWSPGGAEAAPVVGTLIEEAEVLPPQETEPVPEAVPPIRALPLVRKLARDLGVDLAKVSGTGPDGRVTREDVEAYSRSGPAADRGPAAGEERVRLSRLRRTIAENMERSWREIPHVTTFEAVPAERLLAARRALGARREGRFPLEALLVAAVLPVLGEYPEFNAALDGEELILKHHYDIGIAVDTSEGLIVPVIKGAGALGVSRLAEEITRVAEAARARKLVPAELGGQTFTVSNIGAVGGGYGTPIIPHGTTAILSVGRAEPGVVAEHGEIEIARMLPLSLSYDHRVIDGALGRRFMARLRENLEEPALFLAD